jgi:hypothetical protein
MLGDDFTMLDVAIAPLLWRLDHYGIKLGKPAAPLMKYAERIFSRPAFIEALTPVREGDEQITAMAAQSSPPSPTCCARSTSGAWTTATRRTSRSRWIRARRCRRST